MLARGFRTFNAMRFMALLPVVAMAGCGVLGGGEGIFDASDPTMSLVPPADDVTGVPNNQAGQAPVVLGSASTFAVLAGSTVTNVLSVGTTVTGDIGVSPGTAVEGFPPGTVSGTIYNATPGPAATAKLDLTTAYLDAQARSVGSQTLPGNLGGLTFTPGLYTNSTSVIISGSGPGNNATLDAQGDANAVFIFQMGSTLTTGPGAQVILSGGAKASNVYWQVGTSATLDTTTIFKGNILAQASITMNAGATLEGRALTQTGAVSLSSNIITIPAP